MYDEDPRLVVALGSDAHEGPKLSVKVVLLTALTLLFFSLGFYLSLPASESKTGSDLIYLIGTIAFCLILQHEYQPQLRQFGLSREVLRSRRTLIWMVAGLALAGVNLIFIFGPGFLVSLIDPSPHTLTPGCDPSVASSGSLSISCLLG